MRSVRGYEMAVIADEVFLDYAHDGVRRPTFVTDGAALDVCVERDFQDFALPQMKLSWLGDERSGRPGCGGDGANGNHFRHLLVVECAHTTSGASALGAAQAGTARV